MCPLRIRTMRGPYNPYRLSWGSIFRILTQLRVDAILPLSDRTNLLFLRSARAHPRCLRSPEAVSPGRALGTGPPGTQPCCLFPIHSERWHRRKATKLRPTGHDMQTWPLGRYTDDHDPRVPREPGPTHLSHIPKRRRRPRRPKPVEWACMGEGPAPGSFCGSDPEPIRRVRRLLVSASLRTGPRSSWGADKLFVNVATTLTDAFWFPSCTDRRLA